MPPTPQDGSDDLRPDDSSGSPRRSLDKAVDRAIAETNQELKKAKAMRETQRLRLDEILKKVRKQE